LQCVIAARLMWGGQLRSRHSFAGEEATVKVCGVGVAMLPGHSWTPHSSIGYVVNVGTTRGRPSGRTASSGRGQARRRLTAVGGAEAP
jgi:hypothetical protein